MGISETWLTKNGLMVSNKDIALKYGIKAYRCFKWHDLKGWVLIKELGTWDFKGV